MEKDADPKSRFELELLVSLALNCSVQTNKAAATSAHPVLLSSSCLFFKTGFHCSFGTCPAIYSVDQTCLILTEIHPPTSVTPVLGLKECASPP